jgi:hypothetical protein
LNNHAVNNQRDFWQQVLDHLQQGDTCALLSVVESIGSSPGRKGFKMCVVHGGGMFGSIGGGSMEHKLVELARTLLERTDGLPLLKRQIHQADMPPPCTTHILKPLRPGLLPMLSTTLSSAQVSPCCK